MARQQLRALARVSFIACGLSLVGLSVLLALRTDNDLTSLGALLAGVLLIVAAAVGRLPEEIGLQRISFGEARVAARDYREALYGAVLEVLPELEPPKRGSDWQSYQPTYWVDELQLRIVVTWAPDESWRLDISMLRPVMERAGPDTGVLLVTNVDEIDDLQSELRSGMGERGAVVRWRSSVDNDQLRRTAHELQAHNGQ